MSRAGQRFLQFGWTTLTQRLRTTFPTPGGNLSGTQTIRVYARKIHSGRLSPTLRLDLHEGLTASMANASAAVADSYPNWTIVELSFPATTLSDLTGAGVEVRLSAPNTTDYNALEIGYVEWVANTSAGAVLVRGAISHMAASTSNTTRRVARIRSTISFLTGTGTVNRFIRRVRSISSSLMPSTGVSRRNATAKIRRTIGFLTGTSTVNRLTLSKIRSAMTSGVFASRVSRGALAKARLSVGHMAALSGASVRFTRAHRRAVAYLLATGFTQRLAQGFNRAVTSHSRILTSESNRDSLVKLRSVVATMVGGSSVSRLVELHRNANSWLEKATSAAHRLIYIIRHVNSYATMSSESNRYVSYIRSAIAELTAQASSERALAKLREVTAWLVADSDSRRIFTSIRSSWAWLTARAYATSIKSGANAFIRTARSYMAEGSASNERVLVIHREVTAWLRDSVWAQRQLRNVRKVTSWLTASGYSNSVIERLTRLLRSATSSMSASSDSRRSVSSFRDVTSSARDFVSWVARKLSLSREETTEAETFGGESTVVRSYHRTANTAVTFGGLSHVVKEVEPFLEVYLAIEVAKKRGFEVITDNGSKVQIGIEPKIKNEIIPSGKVRLDVAVSPKIRFEREV